MKPPEGNAPEQARRASTTHVAVAAVSLHGEAFTTGTIPGDDIRTGCGFVVSPAVIIDGKYFDPGHQWDEDALWWDTSDATDRWIELELDGTCAIEEATVQIDDNDQ